MRRHSTILPFENSRTQTILRQTKPKSRPNCLHNSWEKGEKTGRTSVWSTKLQTEDVSFGIFGRLSSRRANPFKSLYLFVACVPIYSCWTVSFGTRYRTKCKSLLNSNKADSRIHARTCLRQHPWGSYAVQAWTQQRLRTAQGALVIPNSPVSPWNATKRRGRATLRSHDTRITDLREKPRRPSEGLGTTRVHPRRCVVSMGSCAFVHMEEVGVIIWGYCRLYNIIGNHHHSYGVVIGCELQCTSRFVCTRVPTYNRSTSEWISTVENANRNNQGVLH